MAIELATQFQAYTDEQFYSESKTSLVTNKDFSFDGAKTIKLYKMQSTEMEDFNRNGPILEGNKSQYGTISTLQATTETFTINKDRSFTFEVDKMDTDETKMQVAAASALARQQREKVFPEIDSYVYSVMAANAGIKPEAAALTAAGDVLKGVAAVCIGRWLFGFLPENAAVSPYLGVYLTAILAVVGHLKPLYFGFKGGKGVLVAAGAILAVQPVLLPVLALIFLVCLVPTGMVSLGSITMAAAYPVMTLVYSLMRGLPTQDVVVCTVGAAIMGGMVIWMHRSNIQRIRDGKEYRFGQKHKSN